jgi:hypothetical protein
VVRLAAGVRPGRLERAGRPRRRRKVEARLRERLPYATVFTHLEPAEDPRSFDDTTLDRPDRVAS